MTNHRRLGAAMMCAALTFAAVYAPGVLGAVTPAGGEKPIREIFVPFEDLHFLLESDAQRVFLTREQYEDLLQRAKKTPDERAPRKVMLTSADYEGDIADGRATIRGVLRLAVVESGLHALPLDLARVGLRSALLDNQPAALGRDRAGNPLLFIAGEGAHELRLDAVAAVTTAAAQQTLQFELPTPPVARLNFTVAGDVNVRSGAAVVRRVVDEQTRMTRLELVPQRGPVTLVLSLNNRQLLQQRSVLARSVLVDEVTQEYERLHATVSLGIVHGAVDRFRLAVPAGFEVTEVASPLLARWVMESAENDGPRVLVATLREPTTETVVLHLSAVANRPPGDRWSFPRVEALDVVGQVAVVGLLVEDRLDVDTIAPSELISINNQVLREALPESLFRAEPGAPRVRPIVAYYAPQAKYGLTARFTKPPARVRALTNLVLTLENGQQRVRAGFLLSPQIEKLFSAEIAVPAGWHVQEVTTEDGKKLTFESFSANGTQGTRLQVRLPQGVAPGGHTKLYLQAANTPQGWLDDWSTTMLPFPVFAVTDAEDRGAVAILALDDMTVRPDSLKGLTPLDEKEKAQFGLEKTPTTLAYRYEAPGYAATIAVERMAPWVTARSFSFFKIDPEGLSAHYELVYDVRHARVRRLKFRLPENTPATLSISGLDGLAVKESTSQIVSPEGRRQRQWTVSLADSRHGTLRLAVAFQQRLDYQDVQDVSLPLADDLVLPLIRADEVEFQSATISVEGNPEFDVHVNHDPARNPNIRKIDVGELAEANYTVGRRFLGAFSFAGDRENISVDVFRRAGHAMPAAIVQRAELVTLATTTGVAQTSARFQLKSKASYLEVTLPEKATLWSATIDGKPSTPQREGDRLLIGLPPAQQQQLRDVQIVFETPLEHVMGIGDIEIAAPALALRDETGQARAEVPVADVQWHLVAPPGHEIIRSSGTVFLAPSPRPSPLVQLAGAIYQIAGGVRPFYWARVVQMSTRLSTRDGAMPTAVAPRSDAESEQMGVRVNGFRAGRGDDAPGAPAGAPARDARPSVAKSLALPPAAAEPAGAAGMPSPGMMPAEKAMPAAPKDAAGAQTQAPATLPAREVDFVENLVVGSALLASAGDKFWAMAGVRSLQIDLDPAGAVTFDSMGVAPRLKTLVARRVSLDCFAWGLAILVGLIGVAMTDQPLRRKAAHIVESAALALLLPLLVAWFAEVELRAVFEPAFWAACLLVPYYLLAGVARWIVRQLRRMPLTRRVSAAAMILVLTASSAVLGQQPAPSGLEDLAELLKPLPPLKVPDDAVVIPYDAQDRLGIRQAEKVLIPYRQYTELWNRAFPTKPLEGIKPPAPYSLAGAKYQATLAGGDYLSLSTVLDIEVYVDGDVSIPLPLVGGVLNQAKLDGQPARVRVVQPTVPAISPQAQPQAANAPPQQAAQMRAPSPPVPPPGAVIVLQAAGKGRKRLELAFQFRLERSGGWRIVRAQVPTAPAAQLTLIVPESQTEVRLSGIADREAYETKTANETIDTALESGGQLALQWRPRVAAGQVDQSLTANSQAVLDVREDGLRLVWRLDLDFPRSQRESFTVLVPAGYLLKHVQGDNVRGWRVVSEGVSQRVEVTLLKATTGKDSFTMDLMRVGAVGTGELAAFSCPVVIVPEANLHQGSLVVRRSPWLDMRPTQTQGLNRADTGDETLRLLKAELQDDSPLGIRTFQAYRFATTPFQLAFSATQYRSRIRAEVQTLLKIGERESAYESRVVFDAQDRPAYRVRFRLPEGLKLDDVACDGACEWGETAEANRSLLTIHFAEGRQGGFSVVVRGTLGLRAGSQAIAAPRFEVLDVDSQEGYLVVQADPAYDVRVESPQNVENVLLQRVFGWLKENQRQSARVALFYRSADFAASILTTPRKPRVRALAITNVRVTTRAVEQSVYLEYTILEAGIREVAFQLPKGMERARVAVPMLRQKTIEAVANDASVFRMRLELQDEVMQQLIVRVEQDRELSSGSQTAPIPVLENCDVEARYVVLESAGRDELLADTVEGLEELKRQQSEWGRLTGILGDKITKAFLVKSDVAKPRLAFRSEQRSAMETTGAKIGLAHTVLLVDGNGAFRGVQEYRVDNKTEPFLEIELPPGARLWTVRVDAEPVKPSTASKAGTQVVRIPLVKTADGDLDYPVELKYGGQLPAWGMLQQVRFPLPRVVNIDVKQSQVRLFLSETHRWFDFGGSLGRPRVEDDLAASFLNYRNQQIRELTQILSGTKSAFGRMRAGNNLKQLAMAINNYSDTYSSGRPSTYNEALRKEMDANTIALNEAQQQLKTNMEGEEASLVTDNRDRLATRYRSQGNARSKGVVSQLGTNFFLDAPPQAPGKPAESAEFNKNWFKDAQLEAKRIAEVDEKIARITVQSGQAPSRGQTSRSGGEGDQRILADEGKNLGLKLGEELRRSAEGRQAEETAGQRRDEVRQQVERYQQQLERKAAPATPSPSQQPGQGQRGGLQIDGDVLFRLDKPMKTEMNRELPPLSQLQDQIAGPANAPAAGEVGGGERAAVQQLPASGLASLDIELPQRGTTFLFTTPRAAADITARSLTASQFDRFVRLAQIVACLLALFLLGRALRYLNRNVARRWQELALVLLGFASLVSGFFPIAGLAATVVGIGLALSRRREIAPTMSAPPTRSEAVQGAGGN